MGTVTLYGLKACDTCRKALKDLRSAGMDATLRDVREQPLDSAVLDGWSTTFGADLVNRRSATWRGLNEDDRALPITALLKAYPAVMKRPVIDIDGALFLGWTPQVKDAVLGQA